MEEQKFTLKILGEEKEVTRDELIVLAQKGMDYDRIRASRDEMQPVFESVKKYAESAGKSVSDLTRDIQSRAEFQSRFGRDAEISSEVKSRVEKGEDLMLAYLSDENERLKSRLLKSESVGSVHSDDEVSEWETAGW